MCQENRPPDKENRPPDMWKNSKKKTMKKKTILKIILVVCLLAVATFASLLARELYIDWKSKSFYDDFAGIETRPHESAGQNPNGNQDKPGGWQPYIDFDALKEQYPDIVGWIKLDNTPINYPVMQHTDNDFYLSHLPNGTQHRNGSIFLDFRNNSDFSDKSILIYGHHTRTEDMFGIFKYYREQEFYDANPVIELYTPEEDYKIVIFAGHLAHSVRDHPPLEFENDEEFLEYIRQIRNKSVFNSNVEVTAEDRIVSLVTCAYDFNEARLILAGILA